MEINKILITGGAGFIGSHVFDHFSVIFKDSEIEVFDKMTYAANKKNIPTVFKQDNFKFIQADLIDIDACLKATYEKDLVINLAAESHVGNSFEDSIVFSRSNSLGTHTLIEACKRNNVKKIIHVSTDEVYGENIDSKFSENDPLNPTNPYSATKAAAEMIVQGYFKSFHLPVVVVRANNIYGIRQYPEKIIPKFITRALEGLPLEIQGDGSHRRHYLSALDFAEALEIVLKNFTPGQIFNIASDLELTNLEVAQKINDLLRPNSGEEDILFVADRPFNDSRYAVNDSKIRDLGWKPKKSLINDLPQMIEWYKKNKNWFEAPIK